MVLHSRIEANSIKCAIRSPDDLMCGDDSNNNRCARNWCVRAAAVTRKPTLKTCEYFYTCTVDGKTTVFQHTYDNPHRAYKYSYYRGVHGVIFSSNQRSRVSTVVHPSLKQGQYH